MKWPALLYFPLNYVFSLTIVTQRQGTVSLELASGKQVIIYLSAYSALYTTGGNTDHAGLL